MPRPRKSAENRRVRWDALYVNDKERAEIKAAARAAGTSVSRYLVGLHYAATPRRGPDRSAVLAALIQAERQLEILAQLSCADTAAIGAVKIQAQLLDIERSFRREALLPGAVREEALDEDTKAC